MVWADVKFPLLTSKCSGFIECRLGFSVCERVFLVSNLIFLSLKSQHKGLISYHPAAANNVCPIPREPVSASLPCHAPPSVNASEAACRVTAALGPQELCAACDCRESVICPSVFHLNGKWKMPTSVTSAKLAKAVQVVADSHLS